MSTHDDGKFAITLTLNQPEAAALRYLCSERLSKIRNNLAHVGEKMMLVHAIARIDESIAKYRKDG